ncbi:MAG TPA: hypothetical protein VFU98_19150 [Microlunatus sp.]|nr:hypothetical protein [Microlunatus sp.]
MGFTLNDNHVRGLLFVRRADADQVTRFQGKWKYEISLDMTGLWDLPGGPVEAVREAWQRRTFTGVQPAMASRGPIEPHGFWLVVPDPCHKQTFPVMVAV